MPQERQSGARPEHEGSGWASHLKFGPVKLSPFYSQSRFAYTIETKSAPSTSTTRSVVNQRLHYSYRRAVACR